MKYQLRDYQQQASDASIRFFRNGTDHNGLLILPTGSGKSLVIADIAHRLDGNVLVFQPSKEILEQNYAKLKSYGVEDCSIYSASLNKKEISRITFATIGSVKAHMEDFNHFKYIIVDECHTCNPQGGMYRDFFDCAERKILGLTATPYRLYASLQYINHEGKQVFRPREPKENKILENQKRQLEQETRLRISPELFPDKPIAPQNSLSPELAKYIQEQNEYKRRNTEFENMHLDGSITPENKCILKFLTRMRPRIFSDVVYQVDISTLLQRGYLARLRYFDLSIMNHTMLKRNSTGMDFDDSSLKFMYEQCNLSTHLINVVRRLQNTKDGRPRKGILVFTRFIEESELLCEYIDGCAIITGSTKKKERERILEDFKAGKIKVVTNVGVLTTGFDYPELDTVVMARPTMSLALYYQIVGRAIRPHPNKECSWIVDLCGNYKRFGRVEDLHLQECRAGEYIITGSPENQVRQLTNIYF